MSTLYVNGAALEDSWVSIDGEQPVPEGEDVIVSLNMLQEQDHGLLRRNSGRLGVHLEAGESIDDIADHLEHLSLVALDFPSFADGRAFSQARLLRDRHGFEGQVRATGDVRIDQVSHMRRCGFNAMLVTNRPTIDALNEEIDSGLDLFYQPAVGDNDVRVAGKSWARRGL
jgi:uncharacterized protein (DUF934 family)